MNTVKPLKVPFALLCAASSGSGKSHLVRDLILNHYRMFEKPLVEIVWLYHKRAYDTQLVKQLETGLDIPIRFIEGFPAKEIAEGTLFNSDNDAIKLLVMDDIVVSAMRSPVFIEMFTIMSHHNNMCIIGILQNMHSETSATRQIMNNIIRNVSYVVLFPDRRNMQACKQIARTYFSDEEYKLNEPFKHLIESKQKFIYMVIDFVDADIPVKFNTLRPTDDSYYFTFPSAPKNKRRK